MKKILIVDDEYKIREIVRMNLELAGYECIEAGDGEEAIEIIGKQAIDLVLLDIILPKKDGYKIAEEFVKRNIPIIFLSAKETITDKVKGLKLGADDYIVKPFEAIELLARIEAVLRRKGNEDNIFKYLDVEVDLNARVVKKRGQTIELTSQEYSLLETLIKNKNLALSRECLLERAWGYDYMGNTRTVDIHIQRLRKKLDWEDIIITVYKYGYRLQVQKNND